jgi:type I restriction enzyme S subunit
MYGGTKQGLSLDDVKNYPILLPPMPEQELLVRDIEAKTHAASVLIECALREIALLRAYSIRLIADVVMGKLDVREVAAHLPDAPDETAALDDAEALAEDDDALPDGELEVAAAKSADDD